MEYTLNCILAISNNKEWGDQIENILDLLTNNYQIIEIEDLRKIQQDLILDASTTGHKQYFIEIDIENQTLEVSLWPESIHFSGMMKHIINLIFKIRQMINQSIELVFFDNDYNYDIQITKATTIEDIMNIFPKS